MLYVVNPAYQFLALNSGRLTEFLADKEQGGIGLLCNILNCERNNLTNKIPDFW